MTAVAAVLTLALGGTGWMPAVAAEVTVVDVTVTPAASDLAGGFAVLTLDVALQSDVPLDDRLGGDFGNPFITTSAVRTDGRDGIGGASEALPQYLLWGVLVRASGTPTDGVWRARTTVSNWWSGTWRLDHLVANGETASLDVDLEPFAVTLDLGSTELPPWKLEAVPLAPMRVVTGDETWTGRVRVTNRATGTGIPAFIGQDVVFDYLPTPAREPAGYPYFNRADAAGYWAWTIGPVAAGRDQIITLAYGGRGSRGFSLESAACVEPLVKRQATERVAVSGQTVTVTGNAFPAPSIYAAANPGINLQVLTSGRWTTVAGSHVRLNGRYTLTWQAPAAGTYQIRAYKPGGQAGCRSSVGMVLAAVPVTIR